MATSCGMQGSLTFSRWLASIYDILKDPEKRAIYDRVLVEGELSPFRFETRFCLEQSSPSQFPLLEFLFSREGCSVGGYVFTESSVEPLRSLRLFRKTVLKAVIAVSVWTEKRVSKQKNLSTTS